MPEIKVVNINKPQLLVGSGVNGTSKYNISYGGVDDNGDLDVD
jgi:hypothetical protein